MWICKNCGRIFDKTNQPHSCQKVPLETHFQNKAKAKELFDDLLKKLNGAIGKCQLISLPCCVHLFGTYDFMAALPKKDKLEIRFALNRKLVTPRLKASVPLSSRTLKHCIDIHNADEIDRELLGWLSEAYHLKDK